MPDKKIIPEIIKKYGYDFPKDTKKVWELDIPTIEIPIEDVMWHFSIPFWGHNGVYYNLTANEVIENIDKYPEHYERIMNSDTSYPIDLLDNRPIYGRLLMLDGLHRVVKLYLNGHKTIKARIVSRKLIPKICKDGSLLDSLNKIFEENKDKRICVVATSCAGKSTLMNFFECAQDMDDILFPLLTKEERDYVCGYPWTETIGEYMDNLAKTKLHITPGMPLFGTVILDADIIVFLHINKDELKSRCSKRKANFENCLSMQNRIEDELKQYKDKVIKLELKGE